MSVKDFKDLRVWQRAMALAQASYAVAARLPIEEQRRLADQLRRAAASVPTNIAEGHASPYRREFLRYLRIAHGSTKEVESVLLLAVGVGHVHRESVADALSLAEEVSRMLRVMRRALGEPPHGSSGDE